MVLQIAAWLYGTSLAKLVGEVIVKRLGLDLFPRISEVLMPIQLGVEKTLDLTIFSLSILFAVVIFAINYWLRKRASVKFFYFDWLFLGFSFLFFWQAWFVHTAAGITIAVAGMSELIYLGVSLGNIKGLYKNITLVDFPWQKAVLAGYWLMTVMSLATTSLLLRLSMVILVLGVYLGLFSHLKFRRFVSSPVQLLFLLTLFLPIKVDLLWFGLTVLVSSLVLGWLVKKEYKFSFIDDAVIITLVTFNLRFYIGNYDFIEEGFWLGWVQRLAFGEVMYRDFWAYHPSLIPKFIYLVMQIFGQSVYGLRLALQILRVLGLIFFFYLVKEVLENKISKIFLFVIALGITTILVRNNVEIRLGIGLLAILFWYRYLQTKNSYWLLGSGVVTALSGLVSLEVGVATALALLSALSIFGGKKRLKRIGNFFVGGLIIAVPVVLKMMLEGSLLPAIEQLNYYSSVFAAGYFNASIPSTAVSAYYQWSLFDEHLSSQLFGWELAKLGLLLGIFLVVMRVMEKKMFDERDKLVAVLTLFNLIIFRSALGRSDWYHLLFGLLVSLIILAVVLEKTIGNNKTAIVLGVLLIVFGRTNGLRVHLDNLFLNWQTHGQVHGSVQEYDFERMGVKVDVGVEVYKLNDIVAYLDEKFENGEKVFMFPWMPDLYFFAELRNPTKNDTPYGFFGEKYQKETIADLENNPEAMIVFNPLRSISGFDAARLKLLNKYIMENYEQVDEVEMYKILRRI